MWQEHPLPRSKEGPPKPSPVAPHLVSRSSRCGAAGAGGGFLTLPTAGTGSTRATASPARSEPSRRDCTSANPAHMLRRHLCSRGRPRPAAPLPLPALGSAMPCGQRPLRTSPAYGQCPQRCRGTAPTGSSSEPSQLCSQLAALWTPESSRRRTRGRGPRRRAARRQRRQAGGRGGRQGPCLSVPGRRAAGPGQSGRGSPRWAAAQRSAATWHGAAMCCCQGGREASRPQLQSMSPSGSPVQETQELLERVQRGAAKMLKDQGRLKASALFSLETRADR